MVNLLSALQQAKNSVVSTVGKAANQTQSYMSRAKELLQKAAVNPKWNAQPRSNIPPALQETFDRATEGFTPAAMNRAKNINIKYTPLTGYDARLPFGPTKSLGIIAPESAGHYNGSNDEIVIGNKYAQDPEVLRHELIHSMDTNVNFVGRSKLPWKNAQGVPYTEEQQDQSAIANESFNDVLPLKRYLTGLGILDSRGFYPSTSNEGKDYIYDRTSGPLYRFEGEEANPQMLDLEGMAYMGTTGEEYLMPQYRSAIQEAIRAAKYPSNTVFSRSSRFVPRQLKPQNHIPGMD